MGLVIAEENVFEEQSGLVQGVTVLMLDEIEKGIFYGGSAESFVCLGE